MKRSDWFAAYAARWAMFSATPRSIEEVARSWDETECHFTPEEAAEADFSALNTKAVA